jgi:hypothetical protein
METSERRDPMTENSEGRTPKRLWDIPSAAVQAGYSSLQFRRILEEDGIPVLQIGRKTFILGTVFENWQLTRRQSEPKRVLREVRMRVVRDPAGAGEPVLEAEAG